MAARVLWVIKGLGPGGAERLLLDAATTHHPSAVSLDCAYVLPWKFHLADDLAQAGVRTICVSQRRNDLWWPVRLARLVRSGGYDVVHVHSPLPGGVARLAARTTGRTRRPALVTTEHNQWSTHRRATRWLNRWTMRWDDATFAVTDEVRASMRGRVARRVRTLQHGVSATRIAAAKAADSRAVRVRAELGIADDEIVVVTAANFREQKDYPNLLAAMRLLHERGVRLRLVAIGQGPLEADIRALAAQYELGDRVVFTGFRADAVRVMAACDIMTIASKWEGLPVALMEALSLGLPLIATAVGGIAEQMTDGVDALLVPPHDAIALADALARVATDADLRASLSAAALRRGPQFSIAPAVDVLEQCYAALAPGTHDTGQPTPTSRRRTAQGFDIRQATPDDRAAILALCRAALGWGDDPRFERLFAWKHDDNAFGPSYAWVATHLGEVVGLRMLMQWEFVRNGTTVRAVRAVDTATHPAHQGKGLFTAMTLHGLETALADGVDMVFNTPNDKSRPGYLKMGWQEVGTLGAAVRPRSPRAAARLVTARTAAGHWPIDPGTGIAFADWIDSTDSLPTAPPVGPEQLVTKVGPDFLRWRYGLPELGYRVAPQPGGAVIFRGRPRGTARELVLSDHLGLDPAEGTAAMARVLRASSAHHALRLGPPDLAHGFVPVPGGGPVLTWRALGLRAMPPLSNWSVRMGDIELF